MSENETRTDNPTGHKTSPIALIVAWLVVAIPLLWGVSQTIQTSTKLFKSPAPAPATQSGATTMQGK